MSAIYSKAVEQAVASELESQMSRPMPAAGHRTPGVVAWAASLAVLGAVAGGVVFGPGLLTPRASAAIAPALPSVAVSTPVQRNVAGRLELLGQFSAVQQVELRAQVGGTLTQIGFKDGDVVHQGDLLFQIDPTPYQIRFTQAVAQVETARARLDLANREMVRANALAQTSAGTVQNVDQRAAEQRAAQAALDNAMAAVRDAKFDLDHTQITAPFTGRIGSHQVSTGNLISGSRAGSSPTTLLATIVSTDSIYLNFDMSEADYLAFQRDHKTQGGNQGAKLADAVAISLADEKDFSHPGTLDFIDNTLNRASGTIHARATVPDTDGLLTPGGFARVRLDVTAPAPALLVPDASVLPDQSSHIVLVVGANNQVMPKQVQIGDMRDGLRIIRSGLAPTDRVVIDGIPTARPGATVAPHAEAIQVASSQS